MPDWTDPCDSNRLSLGHVPASGAREKARPTGTLENEIRGGMVIHPQYQVIVTRSVKGVKWAKKKKKGLL